jgi:hypothetical protein
MIGRSKNGYFRFGRSGLDQSRVILGLFVLGMVILGLVVLGLDILGWICSRDGFSRFENSKIVSRFDKSRIDCSRIGQF